MSGLELTGLPGVRQSRGLGRSYRVVTVTPSAIPGEARRELVRHLVRASSAAFGVDTSEVWQRRLSESWFGRIDRLLLVLDPLGSLVGWTSYLTRRLAGVRVIYLDTTGVVPKHQGKGLIPRVQQQIFWRLLTRNPMRPLHLVYRTRNPVVWRGLRKRLGENKVAPPLHGETPSWAQAIGTAVHDYLSEGGDLDPRTLVVRGAYARRGAAVYGESESPRTGDQYADGYFDRSLGPDDAFLIVGRLTLLTMFRARHLTGEDSRLGVWPVQPGPRSTRGTPQR